MGRFLFSFFLIFWPGIDTRAALDNPANQYVHRLQAVSFSNNIEKDSLFISFKFDHAPLLRPHYLLESENAIVVEFHGTKIHPLLVQNQAPNPVLDLGFNEYKIGQEIFITKAMVFLEFTSGYNVTSEGNLVIIGLELPQQFVEARDRSGRIEKLKPNKLMAVNHKVTPSEMEFKLDFKRIPEGRITYRLEDPPRVVYDFYNTGNRVKLKKDINTSPVIRLGIQNFDILDIKVTRLIIYTYEKPPFDEVTENNTLILRFKSEGWKLSKKEPLGAFQHKWVSIVMSTLTLSYSVFRIFLMGGG